MEPPTSSPSAPKPSVLARGEVRRAGATRCSPTATTTTSTATRHERPARWASHRQPGTPDVVPALGSDIDGAWWPHTGSVAGNCPSSSSLCIGARRGRRYQHQLVGHRGARSSTPCPPGMAKMGWSDRRRRLMVVVGKTACARLLVIPNTTRGRWPGWCCDGRAAYRFPLPGTSGNFRPPTGWCVQPGGEFGVGCARGRRPDNSENTGLAAPAAPALGRQGSIRPR